MTENEERWVPARLIPITGLKRTEEQEQRASSALLAVLGAVREFSRDLLKPLGAPAGAVSTYTEVPFRVDGKPVRVDGLVRVTRGKVAWDLLIEVKTGKSNQNREQVETYLDVARQQNFKGGLLTISNEIAPLGQHPVAVDKRKYRTVPLHHMSWFRILSVAIRVKEHRGVSDPDQAWILGELIRYLQHENSGATAFTDMGKGWPVVRDAVRAGTLRSVDAGTTQVCQRWDQLIQYIALTLGASLGEDVTPVVRRAHRDDPELRTKSLIEALAGTGRLEANLSIPSVLAPLRVEADLRTLSGEVSIEVPAPALAQSTARVNWLLRQLRDAPADARVDAMFVQSRATTSELVGSLRGNPKLLIEPVAKPPRSFVVTLSRSVGGNRAAGRNSFISSMTSLVDEFHATISASLQPWTPPKKPASAPKSEGSDFPAPTRNDPAGDPPEEIGTGQSETERTPSESLGTPSGASGEPPGPPSLSSQPSSSHDTGSSVAPDQT